MSFFSFEPLKSMTKSDFFLLFSQVKPRERIRSFYAAKLQNHVCWATQLSLVSVSAPRILLIKSARLAGKCQPITHHGTNKPITWSRLTLCWLHDVSTIFQFLKWNGKNSIAKYFIWFEKCGKLVQFCLLSALKRIKRITPLLCMFSSSTAKKAAHQIHSTAESFLWNT